MIRWGAVDIVDRDFDKLFFMTAPPLTRLLTLTCQISDLYDEYDSESGVSSMARTTGYTATAAAGLFLDGKFTDKGVFPPEKIGQAPGCYEYIIQYLEDRGVRYSTVES